MVTQEMKTNRLVPEKKEQKKEETTDEPFLVTSVKEGFTTLAEPTTTRYKAKEFLTSSYSDHETSISPRNEKDTKKIRKVKKLIPIIDIIRQEGVKDIPIKKEQRGKTENQGLDEEPVTLRSLVTPETSNLPEILEEYEEVLSTKETPIYKTSTINTGIRAVVTPITTENTVQDLKMIEEEKTVEPQIATLKARPMRPTTMLIVNKQSRRSTTTTRPKVKIGPTLQLSQVNHQEQKIVNSLRTNNVPRIKTTIPTFTQQAPDGHQ